MLVKQCTFLPLCATLLALVSFSACDSSGEVLGGSLLTIGIVGIIALGLIIYAILDLIKSPLDTTTKLIWGVVIWVLPFIGAILYLVMGRK